MRTVLVVGVLMLSGCFSRPEWHMQMHKMGCEMQSSVQTPARSIVGSTGQVYLVSGSYQECYSCPTIPPTSRAWRPDGPRYLECR